MTKRNLWILGLCAATLGAAVPAAAHHSFSAIFDAAHGFRGCIPGIHEVLRHQGLLENTWCLDSAERLSPGQRAAWIVRAQLHRFVNVGGHGDPFLQRTDRLVDKTA